MIHSVSILFMWKLFVAANVDLAIPFVDFAPLHSNFTLSSKKGCRRFEKVFCWVILLLFYDVLAQQCLQRWPSENSTLWY